MAAKPEAKEAPAAPDKGVADKAAAEKAPVAAVGKLAGLKAWLPAIIAIVAAPATCWAVAEYVLLPKLQQKLAAAQSGEVAAAPEHVAKPAEKKKGHGGKE